MPIYEYHCENCGQDFEYLVFGTKVPNCPSCDSNKVNRLMSACCFKTKGNGGGEINRSSDPAPASSSSSSCSGCSATSCAGCGH
jgi:putative FmdB family regulatory protein